MGEPTATPSTAKTAKKKDYGMSALTPVDPIEKLFVNTRGKISDQFRLRKPKMRLGTVGDITAMTAEQFTGLFGSDYTRVVGNRLRKKRFGLPPSGEFRLIPGGSG